MSKPKGNVINPDGYIKNMAPILSINLMFMGSFDQGGDFRAVNLVHLIFKGFGTYKSR